MHDSSSTLREFLDAAAARRPTPGGGSITALVGALAASMGEMCVNYSLGKKGLEAFTDELQPALAELTRAREMLLQLMVEDQFAYDALTAARKLPPDSPEQQAALPVALLACIRVPESIAAVGVFILERCDKLVNFINHHLLSDLAVCADLAMACIRCATYNVRTNLTSVPDADDRRAAEATISQILSRAVLLIQNVAPRIWERSGQEA